MVRLLNSPLISRLPPRHPPSTSNPIDSHLLRLLNPLSSSRRHLCSHPHPFTTSLNTPQTNTSLAFSHPISSSTGTSTYLPPISQLGYLLTYLLLTTRNLPVFLPSPPHNGHPQASLQFQGVQGSRSTHRRRLQLLQRAFLLETPHA